jgi:hypothetical protein
MGKVYSIKRGGLHNNLQVDGEWVQAYGVYKNKGVYNKGFVDAGGKDIGDFLPRYLWTKEDAQSIATTLNEVHERRVEEEAKQTARMVQQRVRRESRRNLLTEAECQREDDEQRLTVLTKMKVSCRLDLSNAVTEMADTMRSQAERLDRIASPKRHHLPAQSIVHDTMSEVQGLHSSIRYHNILGSANELERVTRQVVALCRKLGVNLTADERNQASQDGAW